MKKLTIYYLIFFTSSITSFIHAENMLTKVRDYFYTTRLFAGYHSSPAEKAAAKEKLEQLSAERDNLQNSLEMIIDDEQEKQAIRSEIAEINKQIYEQKIILGQEMTGTRKLFWLGTGLLGLAALGKAEYELRGVGSYVFKSKSKLEEIWNQIQYIRISDWDLELNKVGFDKDILRKQLEIATANDEGYTQEDPKIQKLDKELIMLQKKQLETQQEITRRKNKGTWSRK